MAQTNQARNMTLLVALAASIMLGNAVQAQTAAPRGERMTFEMLDANGDGQITRNEIDQQMTARFERMDRDKDGVVSREELEMQAATRAAARVDRMLDRVDANGDDALSLDEMRAARGGKMFDRADADGDGVVSRAEFETAMQRGKARINKNRAQ